MTQRATDEILAAMFTALDAGEQPDRAALVELFPGHVQTIDTLLQSVAQYGIRRGALAAELGELQPGTRLGEFVIDATLRRGGMGVVYRARQTSLGDRAVALKVVPGGDDEPGQQQRFEREARLAATLHHEHLVAVHGMGRERGLAWCAMRLVEGPSLQDVLERLVRERQAGARAHALARRRLVQRVAEVADALGAMHDAGLVHRDVKPANIVLEGPAAAGEAVPSAPAVLVDFGLARVVDAAPLTHTLRASATPAYAPPEQLLGRHDVDARADVFALGVTLHDLLCARRPQDRLQASAGLEPLHELIPDIDPDLEALVAVATDPLPEWRYADGAALHADLAAWLDGRPVSARSLMPHERGLRWAKRHPRAMLRAVLLGVAATALLVLAVGVTDRVRLARVAGEARRQGRLVALGTALRALDGAAFGGWFLAPADRALLARLAAPEDPLARSVQLLAGGAEEEAWLSIARQLVARTGPMDGLLRAALLDALAFPPGMAQPPASLGPALACVARACYERPDRSPEDAIDSAPLRARLFALLSDGRVDRNDRLLALWALSGCGTPELLVSDAAGAAAPGTGVQGPAAADLLAGSASTTEAGREALAKSLANGAAGAEGAADLTSWLLAQEKYGEERRVGMLGLEQVLRRAPSCGLRGRLSHDASEALGQRIGRLLLETRGGPWEQAHAAEELARAWIFFRTARGEEPALPQEWCASIGARRRKLLAIAARVCPPPLTLAGTAGLADNAADGFRVIGWSCAVSSEPRAAVAAGLAGLAPLRAGGFLAHARALGAFLDGARAGTAELSGVRPEMDPDVESRLDFLCDRCVNELPSVRVGPSGDPAVLASWDFSGPALELGGAALEPVEGVLVDAGDPQAAESPAVLRVFGSSELHLKFRVDQPLSVELEREQGAAEPALQLQHVAALRGCVPWGGRAAVRVTLDDVPLAERLWVPGPSSRTDQLPIARSQLEPGEHVLRLALLAPSTTTYRLMRVKLVLKP